MSFFKYDSPVFLVLGRFCDIFILNILWLICSIPLITIIPATAALYYSIFKIIQGTDSSMFKMFLHSLRQNLKQGCLLTVFFIFSGVSLYLSIRIAHTDSGLVSIFFTVLSLLLWFFSVMMISYVPPLLAQFDTSLKNILKNAIFIGLGNLPYTIILIGLNFLPVILLWKLPFIFVLSIPVWLVLGVSAIAFLNSKICIKIFEKYT